MEQPCENPVPWLVFEPAGELAGEPKSELPSEPPLAEEVTVDQPSSVGFWLDDTGIQIVRATRSWIQYGTVGFAVICIVIGAVEGILGR